MTPGKLHPAAECLTLTPPRSSEPCAVWLQPAERHTRFQVEHLELFPLLVPNKSLPRSDSCLTGAAAEREAPSQKPSFAPTSVPGEAAKEALRRENLGHSYQNPEQGTARAAFTQTSPGRSRAALETQPQQSPCGTPPREAESRQGLHKPLLEALCLLCSDSSLTGAPQLLI